VVIFTPPVAFPLAMPVNLQVLLFHYLASAGRTRRKSTNAIKDDHIIQISIAHISLMKKRSSLHRILLFSFSITVYWCGYLRKMYRLRPWISVTLSGR